MRRNSLLTFVWSSSLQKLPVRSTPSFAEVWQVLSSRNGEADSWKDIAPIFWVHPKSRTLSHRCLFGGANCNMGVCRFGPQRLVLRQVCEILTLIMDHHRSQLTQTNFYPDSKLPDKSGKVFSTDIFRILWWQSRNFDPKLSKHEFKVLETYQSLVKIMTEVVWDVFWPDVWSKDLFDRSQYHTYFYGRKWSYRRCSSAFPCRKIKSKCERTVFYTSMYLWILSY